MSFWRLHWTSEHWSARTFDTFMTRLNRLLSNGFCHYFQPRKSAGTSTLSRPPPLCFMSLLLRTSFPRNSTCVVTGALWMALWKCNKCMSLAAAHLWAIARSAWRTHNTQTRSHRHRNGRAESRDRSPCWSESVHVFNVKKRWCVTSEKHARHAIRMFYVIRVIATTDMERDHRDRSLVISKNRYRNMTHSIYARFVCGYGIIIL